MKLARRRARDLIPPPVITLPPAMTLRDVAALITPSTLRDRLGLSTHAELEERTDAMEDILRHYAKP